ncbi:hypothetical protein DEALK_17260 [Dehalogenimonas alkenigignens]|uniref:Ion channel n=2 Tax=Dehalogenimonas alkenigignens TaxID=1217799 RepID=A0A0W0GK06_9CHLR|nr:hypothetical protein DEALK_17260 [Dehalogenimonas alkenigignens]
MENQERTFIEPTLKKFFRAFQVVSPLNLVTWLVRRFKIIWSPTRLVVEVYVTFWLVCLLVLAWAIGIAGSLPALLLLVIIWRLLDISQAWFHTFLKHRVKALSPVRSLALATMNYFELFIIFGILAYQFRTDNFYPSFVTITESLRYSIGVITAMGSKFDPASVLGGLLYYGEIAFGLGFLVVIVTRILTLFKE